MRKLITYLDSISEAINKLKTESIAGSDNIITVFRGEAEDYKRTKLMPSLFRNPGYVKKEKYLFELLEDYDVVHEGQERYVIKAIQAQHYVSISRMLDVTYNVLPALYFACESLSEKDALLYVFCFPKHFSPHSKYVEDFYCNMLNSNENVYSRNFKVVTSNFANERVYAQRGGFIFFPGKEFVPISEIYYKAIPINHEDKKEIMQDLKEMFDVDKFFIFPEIQNRAAYVKDKFVNQEYDSKKFGIESEIDSAFERIMYETKMKKVKGIEIIERKRWLRKEKADLYAYFQSVDGIGEKYNHMIEDFFAIAEIM